MKTRKRWPGPPPCPCGPAQADLFDKCCGAWVLAQGVWAQPFQKLHCPVIPPPPTSPLVGFKLRRISFPPLGGSPQPGPLGLSQSQRWGRALHTVPLCLGPAGSPTLLGSCPVPELFSRTLHNCMLCASHRGLRCSPSIKTQAPPVLHTRRWARPRPASSPRGLGLDLTNGYNKSRQTERDMTFPADVGRKHSHPL